MITYINVLKLYLSLILLRVAGSLSINKENDPCPVSGYKFNLKINFVRNLNPLACMI